MKREQQGDVCQCLGELLCLECYPGDIPATKYQTEHVVFLLAHLLHSKLHLSSSKAEARDSTRFTAKARSPYEAYHRAPRSRQRRNPASRGRYERNKGHPDATRSFWTKLPRGARRFFAPLQLATESTRPTTKQSTTTKNLQSTAATNVSHVHRNVLQLERVWLSKQELTSIDKLFSGAATAILMSNCPRFFC